ncbi:NAD(P)/FAD-dependent oxidoreductase [Micromonospora pallida]|uniref:NAD(P)/FAD-dependent oxidoreductase n=1 Tax=Micromonospora pallida TaxID=145854 RepID=UPI00159F281D|nr:FAD-binding oxidoreductase [Micromonospora pallida]
MVVGNGVIGSSIAFELSRRGVSVARIGEPNRKYAASMASGAMLGCFGEVTTSLLATDHGRAKLSIDYEARGMWSDWGAALADASGDETGLITSQGTVVLLNSTGSKAIDTGNFQAIESTLKAYDEPYERVDPQTDPWLEPNDLHRSLLGLYIPNEHSVDSSLLMAKLDAALVNRSGTIVDGRARGLVTEGYRTTGVLLEDGSVVGADTVIIAAGSTSNDLLDAFEDIKQRVPFMVNGYGVSALVETGDGRLPESVMRTPNRAFACGLHCVPRSDGTLYLGATNIISREPRQYALLSDFKFLIECAMDQLHTNLDDASLLKVQVGNRPIPVDGFPLFGKVDGVANLWMATGTYRDGLHQSPLLAQQMADMLGGKEAHSSLRDFVPVRPPLSSGTREEIVETTVTHTLGTGWEMKWNVSREWPAILAPNLRDTYRRIVDGLHPTFTPPPELLVELDDVLEEDADPLLATLLAYYKAWS